jgi:hypothetical protein
MALLATQDMENDITMQAADAAGDQWRSDPDVSLWVQNITGSQVTITIPQRKVCNHTEGVIGDHDSQYVIPAFKTMYVENLNFPSFFATDHDGLVTVTYSDPTFVTVAAVRNRAG